MLGRAAYWLIEFLVLFVLWLLFVSELKLSESLAGVGAAALAATATEAVRGCEHPRFFPDVSWILRFGRVPIRILSDCWLLVRTLGSRDTGTFQSIDFPAGGNDARAVARRALGTLYETLPPGSVVIGIDRQRNRMLLHLLGARS